MKLLPLFLYESHTHMHEHSLIQSKLAFEATACTHPKIQQSITEQFDYFRATIIAMVTEMLKKQNKNTQHKQIKKSGKM